MTKSESMALLEIMEIVSMPGEIYSDGDCLDMIIHVLEEVGLPVKQEITRMQKEYMKNQELKWEKMELKEIIWNLQGEK